MPLIRPIQAVCYDPSHTAGDLSRLIAPPYDVLDQAAKDRLLQLDPHNIVAIDLPHLPPKTVGPDGVYDQAGRTYRNWLQSGILARRRQPALFAYQQTFTPPGSPNRTFKRRGLFAAVSLQPFGHNPQGHGAIHPHEQTFSAPKEDRMKLTRAVRAQLSPIFGMFNDPTAGVAALLNRAIGARPADAHATTADDRVLHELWTLDDPASIAEFTAALHGLDTYIADGHHRYTTALNYQQALTRDRGSPLPPDHPANFCLFVLIPMQDPGLIVLPTHRVLGGMQGFSLDRFSQAAKDWLRVTPFHGEHLEQLEAALPDHGPHALGLYAPSAPPTTPSLAIATTLHQDPLASLHPQSSPAWRSLDVAIVQHLIVERVCQPRFCPAGGSVQWKFPHTLAELKRDTESPGYQLGIVVQPPTLEAIRKVSQAGELMPQKSTFFYPKLATGLVIHPLE